MTDEEWKKVKDDEDYLPPDILTFLMAVPDFEDRGVEHTAPCPCGGTIHAVRATYNGHIKAWCDKCDMRMME